MSADKPGERLVLGHEPKLHPKSWGLSVEQCLICGSTKTCHFEIAPGVFCPDSVAAHYAPAEAAPAEPQCSCLSFWDSHPADCPRVLAGLERVGAPPPLPPCKLGHEARVWPARVGGRGVFFVACADGVEPNYRCWSGPYCGTPALASAAWREVMPPVVEPEPRHPVRCHDCGNMVPFGESCDQCGLGE